MSRRQLLLLSSSRVYGYKYLELAAEFIQQLLASNDVRQVLFIPYALKDHDKYLEIVKEPLERWGWEVVGIHQFKDPVAAAEKAEAFFIGGGNTFRLLKTLYDLNLIEVIRRRVLEDGIPYIGSSAGTNVATRSIHTTNDMPIVYPPSFEALNLIPFNINPHYVDKDPTSKHMGETREERILQYQELPEAGPVLGLREACVLCIDGDKVTLKGKNASRLFIPGKTPKEITPNSDLSYLLQKT
ncbi:alpha-aspartyl dipeptidase [Agrilus planipennis]|uniref:dipeptidase E n=1 Tax=Agrilus planipennis TaxID=224129 RepID=A0A1W4XPS8_AGRPL|nr:alpha-aspartyl dipeptidase [Agrilus planipennis]